MYRREATQFLLSALEQRRADVFRRLADAIELVKEFDEAAIAEGDAVGFWLSRIDIERKNPPGLPTLDDYQNALADFRVTIGNKALTKRILAMGKPLASRKRGRPKTTQPSTDVCSRPEKRQ